MQASAENIFSPGSKAVQVTLELDSQVVGVVTSWAQQRGLTFASVMDQAARQLAGAALVDPGFAAYQLRFDRSILVDRRSEIFVDPNKISGEKNLDRSIQQNRFACGNLAACFGQGGAGERAQGPEAQREREILDYYSALTGNRVRASDHQALRQVFHLPDLVIQAGILHARFYATRRIGSFAYCTKAIANFADVQDTSDLQAVISNLLERLIERSRTGQLVLPLEGEKLLEGEFQKKRTTK
jgi:hypothetical protein